MIHQHQQQISRSHLLAHHNLNSGIRGLTPTATTRNFPRTHKSPTQTVRTNYFAGTERVNGYQTNQSFVDRSSFDIQRPLSLDAGIPAILISLSQERQINIKSVDGEYIRIKDIRTGYCYKFKVSIQTPEIRSNPLNTAALILVFEREYLQDLHRFLQAINNVSITQDNSTNSFLDIRFTSDQLKNQFIELIRIIGHRRSQPVLRGVATPINTHSLSALNGNRVVHVQQPTVFPIRGQQTERIERVQNINFQPVTTGITTFQTSGVQPVPPVRLIPINPVPTQTIVQQTIEIVGQRQNQNPSIIKQLQVVRGQSYQFTRIAEQNRILQSSVQLLEQKNFLLVEQKTALQIQIRGLKSEVEYLRSQQTQIRTQTTSVNSTQLISLRNQVSQLSQKLSQSELRIRTFQLQLSQYKSLQIQWRNQKQTTVNSYTRQISELESRIRSLSTNNSIVASTTVNAQIEQYRLKVTRYEAEIIELKQQLIQFQTTIAQFSQRERGLVYEVELRYREQIQRLHIINQQQLVSLQNIQRELIETRNNVGHQVHTVHVSANAQYSQQLEIERQKFIQQYQILKSEKEAEENRLLVRIEELLAEDNRKYQIIEELEFKLNNTIHVQDISRSNANIEVVERVREQYEQQIAYNKSVFESQLHQLNEQIIYYQKLSQDYQGKYGALLDEYQILSSAQRTQIRESVTTSENQSVLRLKNHIGSLEHERATLLNLIDNYKHQLSTTQRGQVIEISRPSYDVYANSQVETYVQGHITYTTHHHGGSNLGNQEQVIERLTYKIGDENQVIQKVIYKTDNDPNRFVQTQTIERRTTELLTGQEQLESFEKVTLHDNHGYNQQQITTYDVDDGDERYIHKVTVDSVQGRRVHEVDTNIVVHQQRGEIVYDIETQQTNYVNRGDEERRFINQSGDGSVFYQSDSNYNSNVYSEENVIYHGDTVNVVYENQGQSIVIEGTDYNINVPQGAQRITISEETYREYDDNLF